MAIDDKYYKVTARMAVSRRDGRWFIEFDRGEAGVIAMPVIQIASDGDPVVSPVIFRYYFDQVLSDEEKFDYERRFMNDRPR